MVTVSGDERDPVEVLAEGFLQQVRAGQDVSIEDYAQRHPELSEQIHAIFPTLLMMEVGKPRDAVEERSGSDPLLGLQVEQLGDFKIRRRIGRGGMGIVYEAVQQSLSRRVALKVLSPSLFTTPETIRRFQREARAAATLHHTNIVPVFSVGDQWGVHYYAMQYIDGAGLDQILAGKEQCDLRDDFGRIAELGHDVAMALDYAHDNDTLHRDVKPANLLLDKQGTIWVTDFGLAKLLDQDDGLTHDGQALGTMRYMPPEQLEGEFDRRGDIYSLGLTLYELLTWQPAFQQTGRTQLIPQIAAGRIPSLRSINPRIPRDLETIVLKATAREPAQRYATAREMADDLYRFQTHQPIQARRLSPWERFARWTRRNPNVAMLSAVAIALLVAVAVISTIGYVKTTAAYRRVADENSRATRASAMASHTLENIFDRFAPEASSDDAFLVQPVLSNESALLLQDLLVFYEQLSEETDDDSMLFKAAEAQGKVAQIHQQLGDHEQSIAAYRKAIDRYYRLESSPQIQLSIASAHNQIGQILKLTGRLEDSRIEHDKAIDLLNSMRAIDEGSDVATDVQFEIARSLYLKSRSIRPGLGPNSLPPRMLLGGHSREPIEEVLQLVTRPTEDNVELLQAIEILDGLGTVASVPKHQHLLAVCLFELAHDAVDLRTDVDRDADTRALRILEKLCEQYPQRHEYRYSLLDALTQIDLRASQLLSEETLESLRERLEQALPIAEELVAARSDVAIYASTLSQASYQLGLILEHLADDAADRDSREILVEAERHYRKAVNRQTSLVRRYPKAYGYQVWLSVFQIHLCRIEHQQRQLDQAHVLITRAIRGLEKLPAEYSDDDSVRRISARAYAQLGFILEDRGRRDRADMVREIVDSLELPIERGFPGFRRGRRLGVGPLPPEFFAPPPHLR